MGRRFSSCRLIKESTSRRKTFVGLIKLVIESTLKSPSSNLEFTMTGSLLLKVIGIELGIRQSLIILLSRERLFVSSKVSCQKLL